MSTSAGKKPGTSTSKGSKPKEGNKPKAKDSKPKADSKPRTEAVQDESGVSDVQRKMREALEAKQAKSRSAHGEDHLGGHGIGASSNDVTKRQFRRKSGG